MTLNGSLSFGGITWRELQRKGEARGLLSSYTWFHMDTYEAEDIGEATGPPHTAPWDSCTSWAIMEVMVAADGGNPGLTVYREDGRV